MPFPASARKRCGPLALPLILLLATTVCSRPPSKPGVLLVTLDTTRADRIGCYGYAGAETPVIDALAAAGVRFERARAQVPLTLASHASMLTGTYPRVNGVHVNAGARLGAGVPTLAEAFHAGGYRTGAFVSSFVLDGAFGLDRAFDRYDDDLDSGRESARFQAERPADRTVDAALAWLDADPDAPFFAWVHLYDPHSPYQPPAEYAARLADPYDGEIAFADAQLGRLVDWLRANDRLERTLVVVVGDHGESFGEHGEPEHGLFVYDTTIRVPLVLSWPGQVPEGRVAHADVQLVDLYPTLLGLVGLAGDGAHDGTSLVALLRGDEDEKQARDAYGESRYGELGYGWAPLRYLIHDRFKYIAAPRAELYDLSADPGELHDLSADRPADAAALRERLAALEDSLEPVGAEDVDLDPVAKAKLESLGYVAPSAGAADDANAPDPKDMLEVFRGHARAEGLISARRWDQAALLLERLVASSPQSFDLYEDLGFVYLSLGRAQDAERAYRTSLTRLHDHAERLWGLAESLRRLNRLDEAIDTYERSLVQRPDFGEAHLGLTLAFSSLHELPQALEHARRYAEINPGSPIAWSNLATLATQSGQHDEAVRAGERLLALAPTDPQAHYVRWEALRAAGRREEDLASLRRAHEAFPDDWLFTCLLAWRLAVTPGQDPPTLDEALALAQKGVHDNPRHPRSFDTLAATLAARGSFAEAVEAQQRGLALIEGSGDDSLRAEMSARLELYRKGVPYRE